MLFPAEMLMCHKVTHKSLIDSGSPFRESHRKIHIYAKIIFKKNKEVQYGDLQ